MMRVAWIVSAGVAVALLACGPARAETADGLAAEPVAEPPAHHAPHLIAHKRSAAAARHQGAVDALAAASLAPLPLDTLPPDIPAPLAPSPGEIAEPPGHHAAHSIAHKKLAAAAARRRVAARGLPEQLTTLPPDTLSPQEQNVSEIADRNGDKTFLMVDKSLGRILLFEDGKPVFMGNALTGQSTADRLPPNELAENSDKLDDLQYKVTPAGRFTVARGFDKEYGGPLLDVKEIKGKDWGIAIHRVYLGIPSEHRAERLQSPREDDKNITFGCINVAPDTIKLLLRELPETGATALYVLPRDEPNTAAYFARHNS